MTEHRQRSGCWKLGCCGCALPVAAAIVLMVVVALSQLARGSVDRRQQSRDVTRELPSLPSLEQLLASGEIGGRRLELADPSLFDSEQLRPKIGRVVLDLNVGDFRIRAADVAATGSTDAGDTGVPAIRVHADFEADAFRLVESFTEDTDGGFTYEISFRPKGGMAGMMFRGAGNNPRNEVEIILPRGRPLDLVGKLGLGQAEVDLGGLWLRAVDLEIGAGEHTIELSEPLLAPMSSMRIAAGAGELQLRDLGNASPRKLEVEMSVGELLLDLSGQPWQVDSRVVLDFGFGESRVRLPVGARIVVERASVALGDGSLEQPDNKDIAADAPTVTLDLRSKVGELIFERASLQK